MGFKSSTTARKASSAFANISLLLRTQSRAMCLGVEFKLQIKSGSRQDKLTEHCVRQENIMTFYYHLGNLPINWTVAQHVSDPDLLGNVQKAFNHFIQSGQVWALLVGLLIGYAVRGLTTYG